MTTRSARALLGVALVSLPLFAGGTMFAMSLERTRKADAALAANLVGAIVGGLLEYVAMITGFRVLVLVSGALYAVAVLTRTSLTSKAPDPSGGPALGRS